MPTTLSGLRPPGDQPTRGAQWLRRSEILAHNNGLCTTTAAGPMAREIVDFALGCPATDPEALFLVVSGRPPVRRRARCGRPAGQEVKGTLRGRTGLGGVGEDPLTGVTGEFKGFVSEAKSADDRVMETFCAGAVELHVVSGPADPELLTAGRQLADQVGETSVVRVAPGLGP